MDIVIILLIMLLVFSTVTILLLKKFDGYGRKLPIMVEQNELIKTVMIISGLILVLYFVFENYFTNGAAFDELFYKLEQDFGLDFHVFFSESVLNKDCYINNNEGFNPPLIKIISLFIYRSFPEKYQQMYLQSAISNTEMDIRLLVQAQLTFILFVGSSLVILVLMVYHFKKGGATEKLGSVFLALSNIGVLFAIERGNYVILAFPLTLFFVLTYESDNKYMRELGLLSLAMASGLKVYPCLLGLILLKDKRWKDALRTVFYGILFIFGPFTFYGGIAGIKGFFSSLIAGGGTKALRLGTLNMTSIFCTVLRMCNISQESIVSILAELKIISYVIFVVAIFFIFIYKERWKSISMIVVLILLYSGTSHTYMLSFLYLPIFLFLEDKRYQSCVKYIYMLLFILLTNIIVLPVGRYIQMFRDEGDRITSLMFLQQLCLMILLSLLLSEGVLICFSKIKKKMYKKKDTKAL